MVTDLRHLWLERIVEPFAEMVLAVDLPQLSVAHRAEVVQFVSRRVETMPSFTRFGVAVIGLVYRVLLAVPFGRSAARVLMSKPLPILGEYPRLIRSLAYAFVWEHWPDTSPTGASR